MSSLGRDLLLSSITKYFNEHPEHLETIILIINGKYNLSLRMLDWLVTHYAKRKNIIYWIDPKEKTYYSKLPKDIEVAKRCIKFDMNMEYRGQLKSYTKQYTDPFRRHNRITYMVDNDRSIETTIGQLNFFRWVFRNNVLDYAMNNKNAIVADMCKENTIKKKDQKNTKKSCYIRFE